MEASEGRRGEIPILMYHGIDDSGSVISTPPALFRRQMAVLREQGYRTLTLGHVITALATGVGFPERAVVLTFDDGLASVYHEGFPVLAAHGFSATVFLVPGHCGGYNDWPGQPGHIPRLPLLSWEQVSEMHAAGVEFGAHGLRHLDLTRLPDAVLHAEVAEAKAILEDRLQHPVSFFAYPYGRHDRRVLRVVAGLFRGACSNRLARVRVSSDPLALERIDAYYLRGLFPLAGMATPAFAAYLAGRRFLRRLRRALAGEPT